MSALTSPNEQHAGCPSQCKKARRVNKKHPDCKGNNEILFIGDMIVYTENFEDSTKKLLEFMTDLRSFLTRKITSIRINY